MRSRDNVAAPYATNSQDLFCNERSKAVLSRRFSFRSMIPILAFFLIFILGLSRWSGHGVNEPSFNKVRKLLNIVKMPVVNPKSYVVNPNITFGVASAAYQVEGAYDEDGRLPSIWDTFSHEPNKTHNGDTGDVAVDFYHRYKDDIALMKSLNVQMFRMSLSWSRIIPEGQGEVNQAGLDFYSQVLDDLLAAGIEPHVTLYHWDLPQALEDDFGGWLSDNMTTAFAAYAEVAFEAFGDRVKHWTTFNEPLTFVFLGYQAGIHAPGRCLDRTICEEGSESEPWTVSYNVLNAHAAAVASFRRILPDGKISLNINPTWSEPFTSSPEDAEAAQRHMDFTTGLFADPVFKGDWPLSVRERVPYLIEFTEEQKVALNGSADYFAMNFYSARYVQNNDSAANLEGTNVLAKRDGVLIGPQADSPWLNVVPYGMYKILKYVQATYDDPELYITECGVDVPNETALTLEQALEDSFRKTYYQTYLAEVVRAVNTNAVKVRGFFAWSILDNFEWADGYAKRFGIVYVDYANDLQRHVKDSAKWLSQFLNPSQATASIKAG